MLLLWGPMKNVTSIAGRQFWRFYILPGTLKVRCRCERECLVDCDLLRYKKNNFFTFIVILYKVKNVILMIINTMKIITFTCKKIFNRFYKFHNCCRYIFISFVTTPPVDGIIRQFLKKKANNHGYFCMDPGRHSQ